MATYKPSALFEQFRGKIGNSVFTANRAGNNLRNYVVPSNPKTADQDFIRGIFSIVAGLWFSISAATRSSWTAFANAGYIPLNRALNTLGYTGRQAFSAIYTCGEYARQWIARYDFLNQLTLYVGDQEATAFTLETINPQTGVPAVWNATPVLDIGGIPCTIQQLTINQTILQDLKVSFELGLKMDNVHGKTGSNNIEIGGVPVGLSIYLSNALKAEGQSVVSPFQKKYFVLPVFTDITLAAPSVGDTLSYQFELPEGSFSLLSGWYYISLVAYTKEGQQYVIRQEYYELTIP